MEKLSPESERYFQELGKEIERNYEIARKARAKGLDPSDEVEVPLALTMASKVVKLIATIYPQLDNENIVNRIFELEKEYGALDNTVSFKIAEEIAREKYCKFENRLQAIDAGIRIGLAYTTLGVVSSPLEGYTGIKTGKTKIGETYLKAYFSGPIRSAGTTAGCVGVILIDYIRQLFGYAKYDPIELECKRAATEIYDYHERVTNLQYLPTEEEILFIARNLPIQICGDPTENKEVSNYKNLPRIETDFIRGGFCLIIGEGLAQKALKGLRILRGLQKNGLIINDWEWLEDYVNLHKKREEGKADLTPVYLKDLVAGRPVFGHPGKGFRFRYGRSRLSGFSAVSIHPATMAVTNNFIATGTQLKVEKPTKGCIVTSCDKIDGPIVKLKNESVKKLNNYEEAKNLYKEIDEIIYLGDILFPLGDIINRNSVLIKPGYCEEWWKLELERKHSIKDIDVSLNEAIELSEKFEIPLHPKYIYYWTQLSYDNFLGFIDWFQNARINEGKLLFPYNSSERERFRKGKRALELLGVEHVVGIENVILEKQEMQALLVNLGFDIEHSGELSINYKFEKPEGIFGRSFSSDDIVIGEMNRIVREGNGEKDREKIEGEKVLEIINKISKFKIKDKAGEFIGSRMGRPEKAKLRKLTGSPNVIFPVGSEGGRLRSVNEAVEAGRVYGEFPFYYCSNCSKLSIYRKCEVCEKKTEKKYFCRRCLIESDEKCKIHNTENNFRSMNLDIRPYFERAREKIGFLKSEVPVLIKGVRGTSSENHDLENLVKGFLRAKYKLYVNKDGTVRYDMTEIPLTHFKPKEIGVGVEKLRKLGYKKDYGGKELENEDQILELKPHDILIPCNDESGDEKADDVFINISKYLDELLVKFYGLESFFNIDTRDKLVGQLGVCMAPHNCAGVICRIIGFTKVQGLIASPYLHAAMRRDCDGDEAALILLLDVLINFSKSFLPSHRGATQDAPLVLNGRISAGEVDDQILDFELVENYPLELYEKAEQGLHSNKVEIETVRFRINKSDPYINIGFTHDTNDFNEAVNCSSYKTLPTMQEKVKEQMELCSKLRSVNQGDVARLIIDRHFMRDLKGNLRKFTQQTFRCSSCNEIYRRPSLNGKCDKRKGFDGIKKCNGRLIFTISYGGIVKYLEQSLDLARNYNVPDYIKQDLELTKKYIESIFGRDNEKQESIERWF